MALIDDVGEARGFEVRKVATVWKFLWGFGPCRAPDEAEKCEADLDLTEFALGESSNRIAVMCNKILMNKVMRYERFVCQRDSKSIVCL